MHRDFNVGIQQFLLQSSSTYNFSSKISNSSKNYFKLLSYTQYCMEQRPRSQSKISKLDHDQENFSLFLLSFYLEKKISSTSYHIHRVLLSTSLDLRSSLYDTLSTSPPRLTKFFIVVSYVSLTSNHSFSLLDGASNPKLQTLLVQRGHQDASKVWFLT